MASYRTLVFMIVGIATLCYAYDTEFCRSRPDGNACDPESQTSYYVCANQITFHFSCATETHVGVSMTCVSTSEPPCVPEEPPITTTTTTTASTTTTITPVTGEIVWNIYRRHKGDKSACALIETTAAISTRECGAICSRSSSCTDYNFSTTSTSAGKFTCQLVRCDGSFLLATSTDFHFYERI